MSNALHSTDEDMRRLIDQYGWGGERGQADPGQRPRGHRTCQRCRHRAADVLTFNCHHRTLCHVCVDRVDHCPRCGRFIVAFYRMDL